MNLSCMVMTASVMTSLFCSTVNVFRVGVWRPRNYGFGNAVRFFMSVNEVNLPLDRLVLPCVMN
jgi:hypothetical protein